MMFDPHPKKKSGRVSQTLFVDVLSSTIWLPSRKQNLAMFPQKKTLWFQVAKRKRRQYHFASDILCTLYVDVDKKSFDKLTIGKQLYLLIGKLM